MGIKYRSFAIRSEDGIWSGGLTRRTKAGATLQCGIRKGFASEAEAQAYGARCLAARTESLKRVNAAKKRRKHRLGEEARQKTAELSERYGCLMPANAAAHVLGLGHGCDQFNRADVIAAFRRKAHECHPDKGGDPAAFRRLVSAKNGALGELWWRLRK